jgi:glycosyltransferase involved in cell wall biosynthesis
MPGIEGRVSVVVPVYRNAPTLAELTRRLERALDGLDWELLFVDDGCPAGSWEVIRGLAAAEPRVGGLRLAVNGGQNAAVLVGLARIRGDAAVVMDADLQDPAEAVPRLVAALRGGPHAAVFAGRRGAYEGRGRLLTGRLFKATLRLLSGGALPADAGLFVALRGDLVERLAAAPPRDPYVLGLIACAGLPMTSIAVDRASRAEGRSGYTARSRLRLAWKALRFVLAWRLGGTGDPGPAARIAESTGWAANNARRA